MFTRFHITSRLMRISGSSPRVGTSAQGNETPTPKPSDMRGKLLTSLCVLLATGLAGAADAGDPLVASLHVGDEVFWHGPYIEKRANPADCTAERGEGCHYYRLEVAEAADRLRVAIDYPMTANGWVNLDLLSPDGDPVKQGPGGFYSSETFVKKPQLGTWTVVVQAYGSKSAFRLRAKLETLDRSTSGRRILAPNLRLEPPFEFRFRPPVTMIAGVTAGFGRSVTETCGVDEMVEESAHRCLRLSTGPQNTGDGPLEVRFSPVTDALTTEAPMYQLVHYSDGSVKERRAGTYEYHKMHGHYHFTGFAKLQLFRVIDPDRGEMEQAGDGNKSGFCFGDVLMNSWNRFIQDRAASSRSSCSDHFEAYMGLTRGWTDIYSWDTPGNYVEFGDNPDGLYVVRGSVDTDDMILETDESDNVSYAYINVKGDKVRILERGFGASPWDPHKEVFVDWIEALFGRG